MKSSPATKNYKKLVNMILSIGRGTGGITPIRGNDCSNAVDNRFLQPAC